MSDIMINNGDIVFTTFGDIMIADGDDDIIQSAIHNIMTIYGENEFHNELGNTVYNSRYKISKTNLISIQDACKRAIIEDPRLKSVPIIIATNNPNIYGGCNISFTLKTQDDRLLSSQTSIIIT